MNKWMMIEINKRKNLKILWNITKSKVERKYSDEWQTVSSL